MVKCKSCGCENKSGSAFCYNCGMKLENTNNYSNSKSCKDGSSNHSSFYNYSANSQSDNKSHVGGLKNRFGNMRSIKKTIALCCGVFIVLFLIYAVTLPYNEYGIDYESMDSKYNFTYIDTDGDGGLSFDEIKADNPNVINTTDSELSKLFDRADTNRNGKLIGQEYDNFVISLKNHIKNKESKIKAAEDKAKREAKEAAQNKSSSSSSSSKSSSKHEYGETGICMYCGSDQYSWSSDRMGNFECDDCGHYLYWSDIIEVDDLRCPKCNGHVKSKDGDVFTCKKCGRKWNYQKLTIV